MRIGALVAVIWAALITTAAGQPALSGFVEANQAVRVEKNAALGDGDFGERSYPRSEFRAQLVARQDGERGSFLLRVDAVSDATTRERSFLDVREAFVKLYLAEWLDIKAGRQVATWGTGDLIFANDLFAKDWEAFFTGLDDAYLKPPQDLLRVTTYIHGVTAEVAASPEFTPDNLPDGTRLSVFNPFLMHAVGRDQMPMIERPAKALRNGEIFGRLFGSLGSTEWAVYGYRGFWSTPQGAAVSGILYYPRLWSAGASVSAPLGSVLVHAEAAAYISQDDDSGRNPLVANSQWRGFLGAEKSLGNDWTVGAQYYVEWMMDYGRYRENLPPGAPAFDELRSTFTARVNKSLLNQNLRLSAFGYWGASDRDWHARPSASYKIADGIEWTLGANLLGGERPDTMFGQFRDNANVFTRVRYSF